MAQWSKIMPDSWTQADIARNKKQRGGGRGGEQGGEGGMKNCREKTNHAGMHVRMHRAAAVATGAARNGISIVASISVQNISEAGRASET
jgi:hypothetical protein